jgi:hypothetical protein
VSTVKSLDGQDFADIEAYGVERWLAELALGKSGLPEVRFSSVDKARLKGTKYQPCLVPGWKNERRARRRLHEA